MTTELTHFIGGNPVNGTSGRFSDVYNPATGEVIKEIEISSTVDSPINFLKILLSGDQVVLSDSKQLDRDPGGDGLGHRQQADGAGLPSREAGRTLDLFEQLGARLVRVRRAHGDLSGAGYRRRQARDRVHLGRRPN